MVSAADKEFLQKIGPRTVDSNGDIPIVKASDLDDVVAAEKAGMKMAAFRRGLGLQQGDAQGQAPQQEPLAATVVTTSMKMLQDTNKELRDAQDKAQVRLQIAEQQRDAAKAESVQNQLTMIAEGYKRLEEAVNSIKTGARGSALSELKEARALLAEVQGMSKEEKGHSSPVVPQGPSELQLRMLELQQAHELKMKEIELQIANMNRDFALKQAEFNDAKEMRWREYEDKQKGGGPMGAFQDFFSSIAMSITKDRQAAESPMIAAQPAPEVHMPPAPPVVPPEAPPPDEEQPVSMVATVTKFTCGNCGNQVAIPPGATMVKCSHCSTEYELTATK